MRIVLAGDCAFDEELDNYLRGFEDRVLRIELKIGDTPGMGKSDGDSDLAAVKFAESLGSRGAKADLLVACTNNDEANIAIARLGKGNYGIPMVLAKVNCRENQPLFDESRGYVIPFSMTSELISCIDKARIHVENVALTEPEGLGLSHFESACLDQQEMLIESEEKASDPKVKEHCDGSAAASLPPTQPFRDSKVDSWAQMVEALRVPAFAWYWVGQLISGIGTWSQAIAQSWLVLDITHSAAALGTITMLQFLPMLLFSLFGGVIADRLPRRRLLVATQVALTAQAVALGVLVVTNIVTIWEIGLLAFALGTTNAINSPTQQAFVTELVGTDLVANAIALNSVQFNTARMVGGAVGGIAVAAWGTSGALFFNATTFLPIVVVLVTIRPKYGFHGVSTRSSALSEVGQGLSYAWKTVPIRRVVVLFGVVGLLGFNWQVAVPLVARFVLHRSVTGFGGLMGALGAGSLVAAVLIARNRHASERRLAVGGIALGAVLVAIGLSRWYSVSLGLMVAGGFAGIVTSVTANTRLQLLTTDELRGRVMGLYTLLMGGTTPIGAFLLGQIAGYFGTGTALVTFGTITSVTVGAIALRRRRITKETMK
ncbi:MAG: MFS transporter [Actinomycetota bacterium]|nr:MFS transporter [Actinomycetota bacterium]